MAPIFALFVLAMACNSMQRMLTDVVDIESPCQLDSDCGSYIDYHQVQCCDDECVRKAYIQTLYGGSCYTFAANVNGKVPWGGSCQQDSDCDVGYDGVPRCYDYYGPDWVPAQGGGMRCHCSAKSDKNSACTW